jgi:1-phosphatidylinositol-3-phosphate 5-kinase
LYAPEFSSHPPFSSEVVQERALSTDPHALQKALPRLPSGDEVYELSDTEENKASPGIATPTPSMPIPLPMPPASPKTPTESSPEALKMAPNVSSELQAHKLPIIPSKDDSERLLVSLRQNFLNIERSLYSLGKSHDASLNEIRRAFLSAGKGTQKRLRAWQDKHLGSAKSKAVGDLIATEPEWWGKGYHVVPNGNIIVRENDWGSIIAHTLRFVNHPRIFYYIFGLITVD